MLNNQIFEDLSNKIKELYSSSPAADVNKNLHALLQGALTKLELVSREEFDAQSAVLRNTQEKLARLEQKLAELESQLEAK